MITIAVDAMGGDNAPRPEAEGSVLAARELGVRVMLVGQPSVVRAELAKHAAPNLPIDIVPASEVITMEDHPAQAFRRKKDSSVHVAARLVRGLHRTGQDLDDAVTSAFGWAKPDGIVLLSPAAPSFGHFRDYRDRGDHFAAAMGRLAAAEAVSPRP